MIVPNRKSGKPGGWTDQAFRFKLDPSEGVAVLIRRHIGMRRKAHNWAVEQTKTAVEMHNRRKDAGLNLIEMRLPKHRKVDRMFTLPGLRKLWNRSKDVLCVDEESGHRWWKDLSKEAAANGIADAVESYWNWVASRNGSRKGPKLGFPKFHKKGRGSQSYRVGTGTIRLSNRRHVQLPRLGNVRITENARRLDRLVCKGMARIKSATVSEEGDGFYVSLQTELLRPQCNHKPKLPKSKVGVDVGVRTLAVVASSDGKVLERVPNPEPLKRALKALRRLQRKLARSELINPEESNRQTELQQKISQAHADVAAKRRDAMHKLTTRLAKTHGIIVIEDLYVKGMMKKGKARGGKTRRRGLADAALGEFKRQMIYKCKWYGSELILADRWFPSSQTCHVCGHRQKLDSAELWTCGGCERTHHRDDNAAINLARYVPTPNGGWAREGTQQSCGCGDCSKERSERLRGNETYPIPTTPSGVGQMAQPSCTAAPLIREEPTSVQPREGRLVSVSQNTKV